MDTAFVIGNGESRKIFPIEHLKGKGVIYGCNAIYRDHPWLCDHIVAVNEPMYDEVKEWYDHAKPVLKLHGPNDLSKWDYTKGLEDKMPNGLKLYRLWRGAGKLKNGGKIKTHDFSANKGSGCSALLLAAEAGHKHIVFLGFDILGARQWEYTGVRTGEHSREQNNIYKDTQNYPTRVSMKAYSKYEWMFQIRQITRKFPDTNFYFINRREYIESNHYLRHYFDQPNIRVGIYADLQRWIYGQRDDIRWMRL